MTSLGSRAPLAVLAFCALAAQARVSQAAPTSAAEPVRIAYDAPAVCPDEGFFFDQMRARTSRVRRAGEGEPARQLVVTVKTEGATMHGRLDVRSANGESTVREVSGRKCEQVVSALAFVAALGVDPNATIAPAAPPGDTSIVAPGPPDEAVHAAAPDMVATASPPSVPPALVRPADRVPRARMITPEPRRSPLRFRIGADAWTIVGLLSAPAWGGRAWLDVRSRAPARLISPSGRLSLGGFATASHAVGPGRARFQIAAARIDGCLLRWPMRSALQLEPCAFFEAGALFGQGLGSAGPKSGVTQHVTAGPLARLSLALSERVHVGVEAALVFPVIRTTLTFGERVGHEPAIVGAAFGVGVGMNFL